MRRATETPTPTNRGGLVDGMIVGLYVALGLVSGGYLGWRGWQAGADAGIRLRGSPAPHRGQHADTAGLGSPSPEPSPAGSTIAFQPVAGEPPWGPRTEQWTGPLGSVPWDDTPAATGSDGQWDMGKAEQWPGHDDPHGLPDAGAGALTPRPPAPAPRPAPAPHPGRPPPPRDP